MVWVFIYAVVSVLFVNKVYGVITLFAFWVYFPLKYYNGKKGKLSWQEGTNRVKKRFLLLFVPE